MRPYHPGFTCIYTPYISVLLCPPSPLAGVVDSWEESAGNDSGPAASLEHSGHEALQHLLILMVVTNEGLQQGLQTYFYS